MFGKLTTLFKLPGFAVHVDLSWFFLAFLVIWTLAVGLFPAMHHDLGTSTYWWMGISGALGLFASIVSHEFAHSIVARRYDIPMKAVSQMHKSGASRLMVVEDGPLSGILSLKDLLDFLSMKVELKGGAGPPLKAPEEREVQTMLLQRHR